MKTKEFIYDTLIKMYSTCTTDSFGQVHKSNLSLSQLFKNRLDEVLEYIKTDKIFNYSTYGGQSGIYKAIFEILDIDLKNKCNVALKNNPNYIRNMCSW